MDLVSEKMTSLLPEPSNIEAVSMDTTIPNPLPNMDKHTFHTITLGEGTYNREGQLRNFGFL